ncbi:bifunctional indole-3-glycerol-phosphate synthase TrpC/phosphoribosylanthranilate isomerase TrpF [Candidatus Steffania adelgidicola]|uniref:bifunctional indole-3-glycerol-phosphate synthase TrpC/phosphoribosylanthranilate isomerase TrpF n=1 Tax=Candidatus Steffania adelgidicola TaxID=1076626 RepID=UPI001D02906B|nr:bifunctional indole-3-glycerol-phosphate synthase TrpC/phosphoribosylanthranilate isomerase TrpF [Candidatus Steffania adelgidicola]UDG80200.1 Tryptophan biosynthesis protein TrpCF [Candidatus Steffania adelgidicola]
MQETILAQIVADKYKWVAEHKQLYPLESFYHQIHPSTRSFYEALSCSHTAFILECKKASPSQGLIRNEFDPIAIAGIYRQYADVMSVLTDEKYFQGNFNFLYQVSHSVSHPILCKDFIIDPWQIYLARLYQADAILLMLSILDDNTYCELAAVAKSLKMGVLTEVISDEERERAITLQAKVVGINNRDLRNLSIDLNRTRTLGLGLPKGVKVISESGIHHYSQIRELSQYATGFLIGSSLMAEPDLTIAVRRVLLGENKVCGLTRAVDAHAAMEAGAIYGGLIFIPGSPRYVNAETARIVVTGASLRYVGVFLDAEVSHVATTAEALSLAAVQLHGHEDQTYINALQHALPSNCQIWKAVDVRYNLPLRNLAHVVRYVLDNGGGSGTTFDWTLLHGTRLDNVILAGGLSPDNCRAAARLGCAGLDFNSGVESAPGLKDHHKLTKAFQMLRAY